LGKERASLELVVKTIDDMDNGLKDANLSALTSLDCNATLVSYTLEDALDEIEQYFSAYKRDL